MKLAASLLSLCAIAAPALAQCPDTFDGSVGLPGLGNGYAGPILSWDDGGGADLYVGGSFSQIGGISSQILARYEESTGTWNRLGTGISIGNTNGFLAAMTAYNPGDGERLVVAGRFTSAGGVPGTEAIAAWNGSSWSALGLTVPAGNAIWALQVANLGQGERLYAGGGFGVPFGGLAQYDGEQWLPIGTGVGINGPFSPYVADFAIFDDGTGPALYAVGRFDSIDGANTILAAKFDGTSWSRIGNGLTRSDSLKYLNAVTVFDDGTGPALYVAGTTFGIVGVSGQANAAKWDGTQWTPVGGVIGTGRVTDLMAWDNGDGAKLYFSGTAFPGINNFGRLEGNTWVSVDGSLRDSSTPGQTTSGNWPSAFGLGVHDGDMYIGGSFITIGPVAARGIAALTRCDTPTCPSDWDGSGGVDGDDITAFFVDWQQGNADIDGSGGTDGDDITFFFVRWQAGC